MNGEDMDIVTVEGEYEVLSCAPLNGVLPMTLSDS